MSLPFVSILLYLAIKLKGEGNLLALFSSHFDLLMERKMFYRYLCSDIT